MGYLGAVLVVDDELGPRESLRMILHPLYRVYAAADGEEAIAHLENQEIDLVTLDMVMPGVPGMDVLKKIRAMNADVDVVIVSGHMTSKLAQEAKRQGAADVINKPYNVTEVIARVGKLVEGRKQNKKMKSLLQSAKELGMVNENMIDQIPFH
jgi:DNA-binding NtrC family response regulator